MSRLAAITAPVIAIAGQNRQISGTTKTATTKNQIKSGNPSFQ